MTTPPKRGRTATLIAPQRVGLTLPADVLAYLREHWPSASEGVRVLVAAHRKKP